MQAVDYCNICNLEEKTQSDYQANKSVLDIEWDQMLHSWNNGSFKDAGIYSARIFDTLLALPTI